MSEAVVFEGVTFTYPDARSPALVGAELSIPEGAFILVTGTTGSGKSTLLRCINGLVPHFTGGEFSGRVTVGGRSTLDTAPRELADVVAFVPQEPSSSFVLDRVEDELAYGMENLGVVPDRMRRRVEETLDLLNIAPLRERSVRSLSGGERQRVAIAAALTAGPKLLVLDEPTSQLDPQGAEDVLAALQRLVHDIGITVVVAEHRLERVASFADVAIGCRAGTPPIMGDPGQVFATVGAGPPVTRLSWAVGWDPPALSVRAARRYAADVVMPEPITSSPPETREVILRAQNVSASYGDDPVLSGVSLDIRAGEVTAVMGRNGSGKTTLMRCVAGLHELEGGEVVGFASEPPRPGRDVALCPQTPETVLFKDSVVEEVEATVDASRSGIQPLRLLYDLGIDSLEKRHPRDLSAGQRLLVAVAAIAATGAPVLLLDEPTRGLDPQTKLRLVEYMHSRNERGWATVLVTHDVELVAATADRVVLMAEGQIIADGRPAEVLGDSPVFAPQMARVFGPGWLTADQVADAIEGQEDNGLPTEELVGEGPPE
ncbi:MAG: ATP-binding cassette domain-containing protein [Actinomycetota bacterium]|nr:ATP-binding cassette domain-containing protein [Actinomycetota bacterium]